MCIRDRHEHGLGGHALDGGKDVLGGGVHGLAAGDDSVRSQVGEHGLQALSLIHICAAVDLSRFV